MDRSWSPAPEGWHIVAWVGSLLLAMTALVLGLEHGSVDSVRLMIRVTARASFALFAAAFVAAALYRGWPNPATQWLRRNRRYLGLSFAVSHAIHAMLICAYVSLDPQEFHRHVPPISYWTNGLGYSFIIAMAATSFDWTAALLGRRNWQWLHWLGTHYLWLLFMIAYGRRAVVDPFYWPWAIAVLALLVVRIANREKSKGTNRKTQLAIRTEN